MSIFDSEKIINGTAAKRIRNGYKALKENYTKENAYSFIESVKNEELSDIMENSQYVFIEPYYGLEFYKEAVLNPSSCMFSILENEREKVINYIEENGKDMGEVQKSLYDTLLESMNDLIDKSESTRMYANYIKENINDSFEESLMNSIYKNDDVSNYFKEASSIEYMTYAPYIIPTLDLGNDLVTYSGNILQETKEIEESADEWRQYVKNIICGNKLSTDQLYRESVYAIPNKDTRLILEHFMNVSLEESLNEIKEKTIEKDYAVHSTTTGAVNAIFDDIMEATIDERENSIIKSRNDLYSAIAYQESLNTLIMDYQSTDDIDKNIEGYSIIDNSDVTFENAFDFLNSEYVKYAPFEESEEDDDEELEKKNTEKKEDPNKANIATKVEPGKKPQAPKADFVTRMQNKAIDKNVKFKKRTEERRQKGQKLKNALDAKSEIPKSIKNDIKSTIRKLDEKDDERRKNYMTEPGFRKRIIRNLKLAVMYGTAAKVKLALVPLTMVMRHMSKEKGKRIQSELIREIETELKICEEKISDASSENDTKEKYRLMRIKDQLSAELVRVKLNSKYI